jgi:hypothetical protein
MDDRTLAIYCFIDDLLKAMQHSEDSRCEFSDAEVVTTAIVAMLFFGGNFERSRNFLHSSGMMPRMLSRSRLSRRLTRLAELIDLIFHQLGLTIDGCRSQSPWIRMLLILMLSLHCKTEKKCCPKIAHFVE